MFKIQTRGNLRTYTYYIGISPLGISVIGISSHAFEALNKG